MADKEDLDILVQIVDDLCETLARNMNTRSVALESAAMRARALRLRRTGTPAHVENFTDVWKYGPLDDGRSST